VAPIGRSENALRMHWPRGNRVQSRKDRGRIGWKCSRIPIRDHQASYGLLIIGQLREALDGDRFRLDAQPILPLRGNYGRPRFELLIRMLGDDGEIIPRGNSCRRGAVPVDAVDRRWSCARACELLGAHHKSISEESARFAINLSGQSLQDASFLQFVIDQIENPDCRPTSFASSFTETATIGNLAKAQDFMRTLQNLGCQFALDDFGTGVSSLAYLKDLSVQILEDRRPASFAIRFRMHAPTP